MSNFPRIRVLSGNAVGLYQMMDDGALSFGRSATCDVSLKSLDIAPEHCRIEHKGEVDQIHKTGDAPLLLNGQAIEHAILVDHDVITIGPVAMVYISPDNLRGKKRKDDELTLDQAGQALLKENPKFSNIGKQCGDFQIAAVIAIRPHIDIYLAIGSVTKDRTADYPVAIRTPGDDNRDDLATKESYEKSHATLKGISHKNLVSFRAFGDFQGAPFLATSFVNGTTLSTLTENGRALYEELLLNIAIDVLAGLDYLRKKGFVLRNLSAENIMVDQAGNATIINLQTTEKVDVEHHPQALFVNAPEAVLRHRPPEYFQDSGMTDHRSDLFTAASIFYTCLAGSTPWEHPSQTGRVGETGTLPRLDAQTFKKPPTRLQERVVDISPKVWPAFEKALQQEPVRRHRNAAEFIEAIEQALADLAERKGNTASLS